MRKGRLDEIFFVDLPNPQDRQEIFKIHLKRRKQLPEDFDLALLSEKSTGFSGAEIEQAVIAALYESRTDATQTQGNVGKLTQQHLLSEIARTKPLSVVMAEKIAYLRAWAADRTVRADD